MNMRTSEEFATQVISRCNDFFDDFFESSLEEAFRARRIENGFSYEDEKELMRGQLPFADCFAVIKTFVEKVPSEEIPISSQRTRCWAWYLAIHLFDSTSRAIAFLFELLEPDHVALLPGVIQKFYIPCINSDVNTAGRILVALFDRIAAKFRDSELHWRIARLIFDDLSLVMMEGVNPSLALPAGSNIWNSPEVTRGIWSGIYIGAELTANLSTTFLENYKILNKEGGEISSSTFFENNIRQRDDWKPTPAVTTIWNAIALFDLILSLAKLSAPDDMMKKMLTYFYCPGRMGHANVPVSLNRLTCEARNFPIPILLEGPGEKSWKDLQPYV